MRMLTQQRPLLSKTLLPCFISVTSPTQYRKPYVRQIKMATSSSSNNTKIDTSNPLFFWKPEDEEYGYLGQWYPSNFVGKLKDGTEVEYRNCEQYMMHHKGLLFAPDSDTTAMILDKNVSPQAIKALGRAIQNFDDDVWKAKRYDIVVEGNYLKFTQDEDLKKKLLETGARELVEASPRDRIWGVGFGAKNAPNNRGKWGLNLLGKALMDVRERLREEAGNA